MSLDFGRLSRGSAAETATEPRRIFNALPKKSSRYAYPRAVQTEVWEGWHRRRTERDVLIKMNTGAGKTVVGLLVLKSCLNEMAGPAVYVSPDRYLAEQVRGQAQELGLEVTDDPRSGRFQQGKAILVTHVHRLVNGKSVFGVLGDPRPSIDIGSLLIDDAHACLSTIEEQVTLKIPREHPAYRSLLELFRDDLNGQSASSLRDIDEGVRSAAMPVPYWAWADRKHEVLGVLHPYRDDPGFEFVWPLIRDCLDICHAAVTAEGCEIRPPCPPIDRIPSIGRAQRRIYLTATLPDDSVLVTHFGASAAGISEPITPKAADDLGDRMILTPHETFLGSTDEQIRELLARLAIVHNVVVIVPSERRAQEWQPWAAQVHRAQTIQEGVDALREGHVGLMVLISKYDGIDLPQDQCRILVIDGVPEMYGPLDRIEALVLDESDAMLTRQMQRIEQGMGRGVRSTDDFCVVMLLGKRLTQRLYSAGGSAKFSPGTRAQLLLSREVADQLFGQPFSALEPVIAAFLRRETSWVTAGRNALDGVAYDLSRRISDVAVAEREAFELAESGQYQQSANRLQKVADEMDDRRHRGWVKQQAAAYLHHVDKVAAQALQLSAISDNKRLLRPRSGVAPTRLRGTADQGKRAADRLKSYATGNELILGMAAILEALRPDPDQSAVRDFEQAMCDLGEHLGLEAARPELEFGRGPDVLWAIGELRCLLIECKSGGVSDSISKSDCGQLSEAMDWFRSHYGSDYVGTGLIIHGSKTLHSTATGPAGMRVLTFDRLSQMRAACQQYAAALASSNRFADPVAIGEQLTMLQLNGKAFIDHWTVTPKRS